MTRRVPRTGTALSELGFGGAPVGNLYAAVSDDTALATVDAAWAHGVRYFDTAPHYGLGLSERRLGAALAGRPRAEFVVSTKVGRLLEPNPAPTGSDLEAGFAVPDTHVRRFDYSREAVLRSLEGSLARLGLDRIDVVYVHDPDEHMTLALDETFPALAELRDQGVVGAIGAGMNNVDPLLRILAEADVDVLMVAGRWTLADRRAAPLVAGCTERDVTLVAAAAFNSGVLVDPWAPGSRFDYAAAPEDVLAYAREAAAVCSGHGATLPAAALQFPLREPVVGSVVVGMRSPAEVAANAAWLAAALPDPAWADLDRLVPPLRG